MPEELAPHCGGLHGASSTTIFLCTLAWENGFLLWMKREFQLMSVFITLSPWPSVSPEHEWVRVGGTASTQPLCAPVFKRVQQFCRMNKLKRIALNVSHVTRLMCEQRLCVVSPTFVATHFTA